jgi:hypothetical protein
MPSQDLSNDLAILHDQNESFFRRADAVRRLARTGDDEAHRVVLGALTDKEPYVRRAAADGIAHASRPEDLDAVLAAFAADGDDQVRRALLKTLGSFADERALAAVKETAETGSYSLRYDAQSVVSQIERRLAEQTEADRVNRQEAEEDRAAEGVTPLRPPSLTEQEDVAVEAVPAGEDATVLDGTDEVGSDDEAEEASAPEPAPQDDTTAESPDSPVAEPETVPEEPAAVPEEEKRVASAGELEFRSLALAEHLFWVPHAIWPILALAAWVDGHESSSWLWSLVALALILWRRGVQFDGFSRTCCQWQGILVPMRKTYREYSEIIGVEVRRNASGWAAMLSESFRGYMRWELGSQDVVLLMDKGRPVRLKRFRNLAAAMAAARQAADFLAVEMTVHEDGPKN